LFADYDYYGDVSEEDDDNGTSSKMEEADKELRDLKTRLRYITKMASSQHSSRKPTVHRHWMKKCPWYCRKYRQKRVTLDEKQ
jgi:hypothetical protein